MRAPFFHLLEHAEENLLSLLDLLFDLLDAAARSFRLCAANKMRRNVTPHRANADNTRVSRGVEYLLTVRRVLRGPGPRGGRWR